MWTKHTPTAKNTRRAGPAIRCRKTGAPNAVLVLTADLVTGPRADVYSDGDRIAFKLGEDGDYPVTSHNPRAATRLIRIPGKFAALVPRGTTDIAVTHEDGLLVVDLSTLHAA